MSGRARVFGDLGLPLRPNFISPYLPNVHATFALGFPPTCPDFRPAPPVADIA